MFFMLGCNSPTCTGQLGSAGFPVGAGLAQLVERRLAKAKVAGSRPVSRSRKSRTYDLPVHPVKPVEKP
jgi:hypothetical protein